MKNAGFSLERLFFTEMQVQANFKYLPTSAETATEPRLNLFFNHRENRTYQLGLRYCQDIATSADPYGLNFHLIGTFTVNHDVPEEECPKRIALSGPAILYGALREQIITMTSRSVWQSVVIAPCIFGPEDFFTLGEESAQFTE
jgi:preprotein translocase subunit SecB